MDLFSPIVLFALSTSISPGPNNVMIMSSGANRGVLKSLPMLLGICIGFPLMVVAIGLGMGAVFNAVPQLLQWMNGIGILYLLYLAYLIATAAPQSLEGESKQIGFVGAALFQWVNPKAWMMATGAISAYVSTQADALPQVLGIALLFFLIALPSVAVWMLFGLSLKNYLASHRRQRIFNGGMALLLVLSLYPVAHELLSDLLSR